jgi:hypothetical protein
MLQIVIGIVLVLLITDALLGLEKWVNRDGR